VRRGRLIGGMRREEVEKLRGETRKGSEKDVTEGSVGVGGRVEWGSDICSSFGYCHRLFEKTR
jgi:hypothetical protein